MKVEQRPAHTSNYTTGRQGKTVDRIVCHVADGTYGGTLAWFQRPGTNVSAHFTVSMDGQIGQSVSTADTGWHSGLWDMNLRSIGIEHEGQPSKGPWTPSTAQLAASADLVATLCRTFGIPADRTHIIGHNEVTPGRAARAGCPGPTWPWDAYIARVQECLTPAPAHLPDPGDRVAARLFDASSNTVLVPVTVIAGTDKVYISPEALAELRRQS